MKNPIAGVTPQQSCEAAVMTVWPSNGAYDWGQWLGTLYANKTGFYIFRLGNLFAVLSIPLAMAIYFWRLLPNVGTRYHLTNRRVVVQRGLMAVDEKSIGLGDFDAIQVDVRPGQHWYHAGDLVFRTGESEVLRLPGVSRPEAFRQVCLKSHAACTGVKAAMERQAVGT